MTATVNTASQVYDEIADIILDAAEGQRRAYLLTHGDSAAIAYALSDVLSEIGEQLRQMAAMRYES
jgi:hypothetical protein